MGNAHAEALGHQIGRTATVMGWWLRGWHGGRQPSKHATSGTNDRAMVAAATLAELTLVLGAFLS